MNIIVVKYPVFSFIIESLFTTTFTTGLDLIKYFLIDTFISGNTSATFSYDVHFTLKTNCMYSSINTDLLHTKIITGNQTRTNLTQINNQIISTK